MKTDPVALLVDGENLSCVFGATLLQIAREYGAPTVRRVYGKSEHIAGWEQEGYRLVPTRPGKNAADLLLCVEAVSLALREEFHTLLIASSDSDYAYLAEHLRELGNEVIGIGEAKTPRSYRETCTGFVEILQVLRTEQPPLRSEMPVAGMLPATKIIPQVRKILSQTNDADGWGKLVWLQHHLIQGDPNFTPVHFGFSDIESLLRALNYFEFDLMANGHVRFRDPHRKAAKKPPHPHTAP